MIRSHVSNIPNFGVIENYSFNNINVQAARKSKDAISSSVAPISDETGHKAWSAMPLLCYFLLSTNGRQLLHSKDIIELGSGLGVEALHARSTLVQFVACIHLWPPSALARAGPACPWPLQQR